MTMSSSDGLGIRTGGWVRLTGGRLPYPPPQNELRAVVAPVDLATAGPNTSGLAPTLRYRTDATLAADRPDFPRGQRSRRPQPRPGPRRTDRHLPLLAVPMRVDGTLVSFGLSCIDFPDRP